MNAQHSVQSQHGSFLCVTFNSEATPMGEQVYVGLSHDGRHWEALNHAESVLVSALGEKGLRDPFILRSHDGERDETGRAAGSRKDCLGGDPQLSGAGEAESDGNAAWAVSTARSMSIGMSKNGSDNTSFLPFHRTSESRGYEQNQEA
jgi:hypothetical protein